MKLASVATQTCAAFTAPFAPTGRLRAQEVKSTDPVDDCLVPAGGGYRRLENQLYRVEVHDVQQGKPVVKWSRDNASMVSKVKAIDATALTIVVEDEGRDDVLGFGAAKWVELTDEERILPGESGALLRGVHCDRRFRRGQESEQPELRCRNERHAETVGRAPDAHEQHAR